MPGKSNPVPYLNSAIILQLITLIIRKVEMNNRLRLTADLVKIYLPDLYIQRQDQPLISIPDLSFACVPVKSNSPMIIGTATLRNRVYIKNPVENIPAVMRISVFEGMY